MNLDIIKNDIFIARINLINAMNDGKEAALLALEEGMTEVAVADELGVNRQTVRKWAGK